jgi:tetratricopeptide (TPR) repeat protein
MVQSPGGCGQDNGIACAALRSKIERLAVDCPTNPDVLMANALLAFEDRSFTRSQQLIDNLFGLGVSYPQAVELRARIAMSQGNVRFAVRFLEEKIREMGAEPGIRETYASALFVANRWDEAQAQLDIAARLGAPAWRVAYGSGLIEEAKGRFEAAKVKYQEALQANPGWSQAESRLRALQASGKIAQ